jgi:hypothetical protein
MEQLPPALNYFLVTSGATVAGVLFMISVENMAGYKYRYVLAVASFLFLSPFGAWFLSLFVKMSLLSGDQRGASA